MVGKLIVWAIDWEGCVKKAKRALDEFYIEGFLQIFLFIEKLAKRSRF